MPNKQYCANMHILFSLHNLPHLDMRTRNLDVHRRDAYIEPLSVKRGERQRGDVFIVKHLPSLPLECREVLLLSPSDFTRAQPFISPSVMKASLETDWLLFSSSSMLHCGVVLVGSFTPHPICHGSLTTTTQVPALPMLTGTS